MRYAVSTNSSIHVAKASFTKPGTLEVTLVAGGRVPNSDSDAPPLQDPVAGATRRPTASSTTDHAASTVHPAAVAIVEEDEDAEEEEEDEEEDIAALTPVSPPSWSAIAARKVDSSRTT
jgi:hypothetical protein